MKGYLLKIFGPLRMFLRSFFGVLVCLDLPPPACFFLMISNIFSFEFTLYTAFVNSTHNLSAVCCYDRLLALYLAFMPEKKHQQDADALTL